MPRLWCLTSFRCVDFHVFLINITVLNCVLCLVLHLHTNCSISLWGNALHYPIPPHTDKQASQQIQRHIYTNANKHKDTRTRRNRRHKKRHLYKRKYTHLHKHKSTQTHQDTQTQEHVIVITQNQIHSTQSFSAYITIHSTIGQSNKLFYW